MPCHIFSRQKAFSNVDQVTVLFECLLTLWAGINLLIQCGSIHFLILSFTENASSHWTLCKGVAFHQSGLNHVVSNVLSLRMHCHILSRHTTFQQFGQSHVFLNESLMRMLLQILSRHVAFFKFGSINGFSNSPSVRMPCHKLSKDVACHQSGLIYFFQICFLW